MKYLKTYSIANVDVSNVASKGLSRSSLSDHFTTKMLLPSGPTHQFMLIPNTIRISIRDPYVPLYI